MGPLKRMLAKALLTKQQSLFSLDDPYEVIAQLLDGVEVRGFIDLGASHARVSRRLLRKFPRASAYAFEPNPDYKATLTEQAAENSRLRPQFLAVGDSEGTATLNITASPGTSSLQNPNARLKTEYPEESEVVRRYEVPLVTLDGWAAAHADDTIELIKLDIQGGELAALRGAARLLTSSVQLVYTEVQFNALYEQGAVFADIDNFLKSCGYVLHDIYKPRHDAGGTLMWGNAIYRKENSSP